MKLSHFYALCLLLVGLSPGANAFADGPGTETGFSTLVLQFMPNDDYESVWGAGWYSFKDKRFGFYINGQLTMQATSDRDDFYESLNVGSFGDPVTGSISDFGVLNIGATFALGNNFGLFAGIGYADVTGYAEKFDPLFILDSDGEYLVRDPSLDESGENINAGLMFRLQKVSFELGHQSFAKETYLGIGIAF